MTVSAELITILVVDDDALQRMHVVDLLAEAGYRVLEAHNAVSALLVLNDDPDVYLLFTDVEMPPGPDGLTLAQTVQECWPNILLLVTSGRLKLSAADVADDGRFISKPYPDGQVLSEIRQLIEDQKAGRVHGV